MKADKPVINLLSAAAVFVGCKPADEKSTAEHFDKLKKETRAAAEDMKDGFQKARQWASGQIAL